MRTVLNILESESLHHPGPVTDLQSCELYLHFEFPCHKLELGYATSFKTFYNTVPLRSSWDLRLRRRFFELSLISLYTVFLFLILF